MPSLLLARGLILGVTKRVHIFFYHVKIYKFDDLVECWSFPSTLSSPWNLEHEIEHTGIISPSIPPRRCLSWSFLCSFFYSFPSRSRLFTRIVCLLACLLAAGGSQRTSGLSGCAVCAPLLVPSWFVVSCAVSVSAGLSQRIVRHTISEAEGNRRVPVAISPRHFLLGLFRVVRAWWEMPRLLLPFHTTSITSRKFVQRKDF